jgi:hypothetical protein
VPQRTADPNGVIEFQSKNPDLYEIYDRMLVSCRQPHRSQPTTPSFGWAMSSARSGASA